MHGPWFIIAMVAICTAGWLVNNWIRARHGYPVSDDWGRNLKKDDLDAGRQVHLLTAENERLTGQIGRLEERLATVERIVTDSSYGLDREIERLRDAR